MSTPNPLKRAKQRASRIALDYYKRGDALLRWKRILAVAAALAAVGWLAAGMLRHAESRYSPGELAWAHATWEQDCAACHVAFTPIRGHTWLARAGSKPNAVDGRCQNCHPGPEHHRNQLPPEIACASCHAEHRGRGAVLTRIADRACTDCHADLKAHSTVAVNFADVSGFDEHRHPEFKSIAADPGTLKFSHRRHLSLGLTLGPLDRPDAWTLDKIPASFRQQYQGFVEKKQLLKLDCSACHRSGARETGPPDVPTRSAGDYMRPIAYESHCQACHPLHYQPPGESRDEPDASEVIPHRLTSKQIGQFLERAYSALILKQDPSLLDRVVLPPRELPGKPAVEEDLTARRQREQGIGLASSHLRAVCSKCHMLAEANPFPEVEPVKVPQVWLKSARFDHAAHRFKTCRHCHANESLSDLLPPWSKDLPAQGPIDRAGALDNGEVLIPGIRTCLECHGPSATGDDHARGGARTDCVECHWYHPARGAPGKRAANPEALHGWTPVRVWAFGKSLRATAGLSSSLHE